MEPNTQVTNSNQRTLFQRKSNAASVDKAIDTKRVSGNDERKPSLGDVKILLPKSGSQRPARLGQADNGGSLKQNNHDQPN